MKDCGCREDPVTVDDWCYFHLKIVAGLFGFDRNGHQLTEPQRGFIGLGEERLRPRSDMDPLERLLRSTWEDAPVEPWERKVPIPARELEP